MKSIIKLDGSDYSEHGESTKILSYGNETDQWFVNYSQGRYWLTHIDRTTRKKMKSRIRREDFINMVDAMSVVASSVMNANASRARNVW